MKYTATLMATAVSLSPAALSGAAMIDAPYIDWIDWTAPKIILSDGTTVTIEDGVFETEEGFTFVVIFSEEGVERTWRALVEAPDAYSAVGIGMVEAIKERYSVGSEDK